MNCPMKIDITTGDVITPDAIRYEYPLLFKDTSLSIMAYTLETILAEKFETIIHRNIGTTRARDFYDLYTLYHEYQHEIDMSVLRLAIENTAMKRGSLNELCHWKTILQDIREEAYLLKLWGNYITKNVYARNLSFYQVLSAIEEIALLYETI